MSDISNLTTANEISFIKSKRFDNENSTILGGKKEKS